MRFLMMVLLWEFPIKHCLSMVCNSIRKPFLRNMDMSFLRIFAGSRRIFRRRSKNMYKNQLQIRTSSDHGIMSQLIDKGGIQKRCSGFSLVDPKNVHCRDIWGQFFYSSLIFVHIFTPPSENSPRSCKNSQEAHVHIP